VRDLPFCSLHADREAVVTICGAFQWLKHSFLLICAQHAARAQKKYI
jgi:hypothetical protein